jgi:hypothetical protein
MPDYVLLKKDLWPEIQNHYRPELIKVGRVEVEINFPDNKGILATAMKDPLAHQRMVDVVQRTLNRESSQLFAYVIGVADTKAKEAKKSGNQAQLQQVVNGVQKQLDSVRAQIIPKVQTVAAQEWMKIRQTKREYRTYQIKCGLKVAVQGTGLAIGIAGAATSAGAALVIGILGCVKNVVDGIKTVRDLAEQAEGTEARLRNALKDALLVFDDISPALATYFELSKTVVSKVLAYDMNTPSTCKNMNELYGNKVKGLEVNAHGTSEKLNEILEKCDELREYLKREALKARQAAAAMRPIIAGRRGAVSAPSPSATISSKQSAALAKLEQQTEKLINEITGLWQRVSHGKARHEGYRRIVDDLIKRTTPKWVPTAQKAVGLVTGTLAYAASAEDLLVNHVLELVDAFGDDAVDAAANKIFSS